MTEFLQWRSALKLQQSQAAHVLGLSRRIVQYYESGEQELPETVRLAMAYLTEHPEKLPAARKTETPLLNDVQRRALAAMADGRVHQLDRRIGRALIRRNLVRERPTGFAITQAGRSHI